MAAEALLERQSALDLLERLACSARDGVGQVVAVVAPAGIGKTSLLAAAAAGLARSGLKVLATSGSEQERSLPHGVTRALLEPALSDPEARAEVLVDAAAPAGALLDGAAGVGPLHHALYWTVANLARSGPLALVVDDAHWADDASLEVLAYVARRVADLPVLVVVAMRPVEQAPWTPALAGLHADAVHVSLEPLSEDAVATFVAHTVEGAVSASFASACHQATGGNPFYLTELLRDVVRRGLAPADDVAGAVEAIAPAAIVRSVLLRMAGLVAGAPALARACGVLGDGCRLDHAAELAGLDLDAAASAADALTAAGVFADETAGLRFAHPILRAAVVGDVGRHELALQHARAARLLADHDAPVGVVATHLLRTEPAGDEWVASVLLAASREAMAAGSPAVAIELLLRAEREPAPPAERGEHLFQLGLAEAAHADVAALEHLRASIAAAGPPDVRVERALVFAELARKAAVGRLADLVPTALDELDEALVPLGPDTPHAMQAALQRYWIGRTTVSTIDRVRAARSDLDRASRSEDPAVGRSAAVFLAMEAALSGTRDEVQRHLEVALAPPGLLAHVSIDSNVVNVALLLLTMLEAHERFHTLSLDTLTEAGRTGNELGLALVAIHRGMELLRLGRPQLADEEVLAALELAAELGWPDGSPDLLATHVLASLWRGDVVAARREIDKSRFAIDQPDDVPSAMLLDARAQVALHEGDPGSALRDALAAGECLAALGIPNPGMLAWRSHASAALVALGRVDEARTLAEQELAVARERAGPAAQAAAMRAVAATVDHDLAAETLLAALEVLQTSPALLERASVCADLGGALRRAGRIGEARTRLAEAIDLADRCGASPLSARAREELVGAGGRPRRTRVTGPEALTAAERRTVQMAASGMTNTLIAQTLFVSRKTVEKHLANAYGKLGISSRAGLAGIGLADG